ncbi:MAG: ATP-binding protein [Treponemataceae bacterium]
MVPVLVCAGLGLTIMALLVFHFLRGQARSLTEEEAVHERDERAISQAILDSLPGIYYMYDYPELRMVRWNKNHETEFGFTSEELRGKDLFEWHPQEVRHLVKDAVGTAMTAGSNAIEGNLRAKDGGLIPYLLTGKSFKSEGKEYLVGIGIDISERKKAESELTKLNRDLEKRVADRTEELERTLKELRATQTQTILSEKMADLGRLVSGLAHELNTPLGAIMSAGETSSLAVAQTAYVFDLYRTLDESDAKIFMTLLNGLREPNVLNGGADERKRRKEYQRALEKISMDSPMLLAEQLVETGFFGSTEEVSRMAQSEQFPRIIAAVYRIASIVRSNLVIRNSADKAAKVISALRTYGRHDYGDTQTTADVRSQLDLILTIIQNRIKGSVDVVRSYENVPFVLCYPDRLDQVWMNLINNALQSMEYRGRLELRVERAEKDILVSVIDNGPGVPEEIRDKIFDPFFTTKKPGEGTGLGLDICKRLLDQIDAIISFDSVPGRTCFTVRLRTAPLGERIDE